MNMIVIIVCGILVGLMNGVLGLGGGVILVPVLLYIFKLPMHQAIGTSLAIIIPTAISSSFVHWSHGNVSVPVLVSLIAFTVMGSVAGAFIVQYIPVLLLKRIFAVVLLVIATKMLISG